MERGALAMGCSPLNLSGAVPPWRNGGSRCPAGRQGVPPGTPIFWVVGGGSGESPPLPSSGAAWRGVYLSQG